MDRIIAPLAAGESSARVANLQDALSLLLDRGVFRALAPIGGHGADERARFAQPLAEERAKQVYGNATQRLVLYLQLQEGLGDSLQGAVDEKTAAILNRILKELGALDGSSVDEFVVKGTVTDANGSPAADLIVRARDRDVRTFQALGREATTGPDGRYEIRYSKAQFTRAEKGSADLVVRVFSPQTADPDKPLIESDVRFNAPPVAEINLQLPAQDAKPSEFERHVATIAPLLVGQAPGGGDLPMAELKEEEIDFVAGDTGIDRQAVKWLKDAFALSASMSPRRIASHMTCAAGQVPAAMFYGWFREGMPDKWEPLIAQPIGRLRDAGKAAIAHGTVPAALEAALEDILAAIPNPSRDRVNAAVTIGGVSPQARDVLLRHAGALSDVTNPLVARLVDEGQLAKADAHRMGLGLATHALTQGGDAAAAAIAGAKPSRLGGRALHRARDLAAFEPAEIEQALRDANVQLPAGITLAGYSTHIVNRIAEAFPTDAVLHRVSTVAPSVVEAVERVIKMDRVEQSSTNGSRVARDPEVRAFVNLHLGLGLEQVVNEAQDAGEAVATIKRRVGWLDRVREQNPDLDLLAIDYLPGSESLDQVNFDGLSDEARDMVIANLKAHERMRGAGADVNGGIALLKGGYGSATAIARSRPDEIAEKTGLPVTEARVYYAKAQQKATDTALTWTAFHDLERDARIVGHRTLAEPPTYLKQLAGYDQLFGSANFCKCEHCRSVLGPAAYFVDLMYWVERHVLEPSFKTHGGAANSLHLRSRRPDLWTLPLTCENTNTVVPTLDLVNEVLERFIVAEKGLASVAILYERLANVDHSIRLPFSAPVERLTTWLSHLGITRSEIARTFLLRDSDEVVRARIRLSMLPKQAQLIVTSRLGDLSPQAIRAAEAFFMVWLNANLILSTIPGETETRTIDVIGTLVFARASGLDRPTVVRVLQTDFVNGAAPGAPDRIRLESGIAAAGGVQNDAEVVRNLTSGRLDRFERFVRLWRHVPWTATELDYVIGRLQKAASATAQNRLDEPMLVALAELVDLRERLEVPVDELCALVDDMPSRGLRGDASLVDRTFNVPPFVGAQARWPNANDLINATAAIRARLVATLQISDEELTSLTSGLQPCLGRIDRDQQGNETFVPNLGLHERNLFLLYRHVRLARVLALSLEDLFRTIALTARIVAKPAYLRCVSSVADLQALLAVHRWRTASGFSVAEVLFATNAVTSLAGFDSPDVVAARIATDVSSERLLQFSADLFTQIGLSQQDSANVIAANAALLEQTPGDDSYRIRRTVSVDEINTALVVNITPPATVVAGVARELYRIVKRQGAAGFEAGDLVELGLTAAEAETLIDANLSTAPNDGRPFERVPGSATKSQLRAAVSEAAAIAAFGSRPADVTATRSIVRRRAVDLGLRHHAENVLAAKASVAVKVSPEKTRALLNLALPTTVAARQELVDALQGGPLQPLSMAVDRLMRYAVVFKSAVFDSRAIDFIRVNPAPFAWSEPPVAETFRRVARYAALATAPDPAFQPDAAPVDTVALQTVLTWADSLAAVTTDQQRSLLARALRVDVAQLRDVLSQLALAGGTSVASRLDELWQLRNAIELTRRMAVPAEMLRLAVSEDQAQLARGADGVFAAIRSKYPDEKVFREKLEPFDDTLRSRTRDGLTEYLLSAPDDATTVWRTRFRNADDLYHHFLMDVMVEGCARMSRVVAAISSVQLYVHRVLMNLEESGDVPAVSARFDDPDVQEEWWWRKNYQVWVANRKVFLYPENYIEPGLRDDKTPLFKELEDTLLQQQITEQNVLDGYAQYLHGFEEVGRLRVAGAYHDRQGTKGDLLHLFGVTPSEPPVYYYRTVHNIESGIGPVFSAWKKMDLQIPVRRVSPVVSLGRLYVLWVEISTRPLNDFVEGTSTFVGYRHSVRTKFSQLRTDGRWTPPQVLRQRESGEDTAEFRIVNDPLYGVFEVSQLKSDLTWGPPTIRRARRDSDFYASLTVIMNGLVFSLTTRVKLLRHEPWWETSARDHTEPLETYTPQGWKWERTYPEVQPSGDLITMFMPRSLPTDPISQDALDLWSLTAQPTGVTTFTTYADFTDYAASHSFAFPGVGVPAKWSGQVLSGAENGRILEAEQQVVLALLDNAGVYRLWRNTTSVPTKLGQRVALRGINGMLEMASQMTLDETNSPFPVTNANWVDGTRITADVFKPSNSFGTYIREVFLHIPFAIADYLNSQQKFADAQRWYHYLYNPTARDTTVDERKRPWQYREFRQATIKTLRETLTDPAALAAYRRDPFNPHAIARLRPGAYQKAIFMKYVDNLLDWGDSLFSQFTMESVNEATMLYVMAADVLGPRPIELGPCGETSTTPHTYEDIAPLLRPADPQAESTADFLIEELEVFAIDRGDFQKQDEYVFHIDYASVSTVMTESFALTADGGGGQPGLDDDFTLTGGPADPVGWNAAGARTWKDTVSTPLAELQLGNEIGGVTTLTVGGQAGKQPLTGDPVDPPVGTPEDFLRTLQRDLGVPGAPKGFDPQDYLNLKHGLGDGQALKDRPPDKYYPPPKPFELVKSRIVFCIPENKELRGYWDRVEDRLNKIRNCMDISGVRRRLELFAPEIDPRMLVRMRAAGLSLDDVMNVTSGNVPPYRFSYLIEKAKQHASLVQSFGNQLLSALEKRDAEELTRLRTVHEQNLLKLRTQMTKFEIDAAEDTLESLRRQRVAVEYRKTHYADLSRDGLSPHERVQQVTTHSASSIHATEALLAFLGGALSLIPDVGAPTSMKYGGTQTSSSMRSFAIGTDALANIANALATSAGIEATFFRRDQDWRHQMELANRELVQIDKQITAAEIRRDIAIESQKVHEKTIEQVQEIFDLLRDRFTNFGRFTWLSGELQKLHRMAFNAALTMARLAEQACHFEHPHEDVKPTLTGDYWNAGQAGLLAGDRLMLDLNNLERRYIETHRRTLELEQSFSLARFAPDALSTLKTECACTFEIPEWFFDLTYAGHYRRRIKVVRLTIPCVVGPHTNVGATLRLTGSRVRKDPQLDSSVSVPLRHVTTMAASMGQSDAGVFEFNFRDERYMPFEGAGVNSQWQLSLPKAVRPFDYRTISDVILRISYTAEENDGLRQATEGANGVLARLTGTGVVRTLSLRTDFPDAWHMLVEGAAQVEIDVRATHVPFFMSTFDLAQAPIDLLVEKLTSQNPVYPTVVFNNAATTDAGVDAASGLYRIGRTPATTIVAKHTLKVQNLGSVKDIMLRVLLKRVAPPA